MTGQDSGYKKRKKKRTRDLFIQSQRGSLEKFVIKKNIDENLKSDCVDIILESNDHFGDTTEKIVIKKNIDENLKSDCVDNIPESNDHFGDTTGHLSEDDNVVNVSNVESQNFCEQPTSCVDIYDPKYWENLDNKMRDVLIEKGPKREMNLVFPLDKYSRHFSYNYYMRKLSNRETSDRNWLVYSKHVDKVYCFCCKLFKSKSCSNMFANDGFKDWKHLTERLKDHERSIEHMTNMKTWNELKVRFEKNLTIDKELQKEIAKEKERWKQVLIRIIDIVKFLSKRRIQNHEIYHHYLGHNIQNEFISLLAHNVQYSIVAIIKEAKYFSVILDCTPDVSHQEQMTLIIRCQSYDDGSNMKGKHQGVQRRLLDINSKALYMPCACHTISFFGIVQRIYTLFSGSTKRWNILLDHVPFFTVKSLSNTRWESRINSVKAIRFQPLQVRSALLEFDAESLIMAFDNFEFLLGMVICKNLQSKSMCIDNALKQLQGVILFFEKYRDEGFNSSLIIAKNIAHEMDVDPVFPNKHAFRVEYFLVVVDMALTSVKNRFDQMMNFKSVFGFLFDSSKLKVLDEGELRTHWANFYNTFSNGDSSDVDLNDLYSELRMLQTTLPDVSIDPSEVLEFVESVGCYQNVSIAYRILLTTPVTVASAERKRLNGLAILCIEKNILESIDFETVIHDFASSKARKNQFL
ncbi:hypothetical protein N665_0383s0173 [Sinapis alba]|nr:hypothetical protein N665_0383s0173 [Sinapis alba]